MRTQVGIVGAGPAGLMLSHLLHRAGIESVILENRDRDYIESRIRAGLIEQWASDLLVETGVGARMQREGMFHNGVYFGFGGALHYINFRDLVGKGVTIYGQQEVVKDLIDRRLADGGQILFEATDVSVHDFGGNAPRIRFRYDGKEQELACDFIGGCDGFHGICRPSIPATALTAYDREYPFGWVGILSESAPPEDELIYAYHDRGFALYTMRSPTLARLYLQCAPDDESRTGRTPASGRSCMRALAGRGRWPKAPCCRKASPPCAASWSNRCNMAGFFSPGTPRTSSPRRAPRG